MRHAQVGDHEIELPHCHRFDRGAAIGDREHIATKRLQGLSASVATRRCASTCASWLQRIATLRQRSRQAASVATYSTASTSYRFGCRHCESDPKTSCHWHATSCGPAWSLSQKPNSYLLNGIGRATFASCRTSCSALASCATSIGLVPNWCGNGCSHKELLPKSE